MFPETAEQLMRSRYSAFVLKNIPYIVQTTVPSQQTLLDEKALQDWADENAMAWFRHCQNRNLNQNTKCG